MTDAEKAELERYKTIASFDAKHKKHFDSLDDEKKEAFLKSTPEQRKAVVDLMVDETPETPNEEVNQEKSTDTNTIDVDKIKSELKEEIKKEFEFKDTLTKMDIKAEENVKVETLKKLNEIEDPTIRDAAIKAFTSKSAGLDLATQLIADTSTISADLENVDGPESAKAELKKKAKEIEEKY